MTRADFIGPAATQVAFHRVEITATIIRISTRDVTELVHRAHLVERTVRHSRARLVMLAIVRVVGIAVILRRFRDRATSPPSADNTRKSADQRSDRTTE